MCYENTIIVRLTVPKAIDAAAKPINPPLRALGFTEYAKSWTSLSRIARTLSESLFAEYSRISLGKIKYNLERLN